MKNQHKNCPFCGEEILAVAKKCKHCGEMLENNQGSSLIGELEALRNRNKSRSKHLEKKLNSPSMKLVYLTLSWLFGILFMLSGLMLLVKEPLAGITMISASLLILPPARNFVYRKTKNELSFAARSLIAIVLVIVAGMFTGQSKVKNLVTTKNEAKQKRADFGSNASSGVECSPSPKFLLNDCVMERYEFLSKDHKIVSQLIRNGNFEWSPKVVSNKCFADIHAKGIVDGNSYSYNFSCEYK